MSKLKDLGKDRFQKLCDESDSIKECLEKVGLGWNGSSNYRAFRNVAQEFNVDLSKLENNRKKYWSSWSKEKHSIEELFCENSVIARGTIRKYIIRNNLIEHKNGIANDHRLENLEFLCPNCHSQTRTYAGKNNKIKKN